MDNASSLRQNYTNFLKSAAEFFPRVDQKLLLTMLQYQTAYPDWEGSILLKVVYGPQVDAKGKKESIYSKFQRVGTIEGGRTVRFKAIRFYIEDLDKLLAEDPDIEFVTGSATLTPSDAYSA